MAMMSTTGAGVPRGDRSGGPPNMGGGGHGGMYGGGSNSGAGGNYPPMYPSSFSSGPQYDTFEETAYLYIPNYSVGAVIGANCDLICLFNHFIILIVIVFCLLF